MIDLSHYQEFGYQILKNVFPSELIKEINIFLEDEKDKTLALLRKTIQFQDYGEFIKKTKALYENEQAFQSIDSNTKSLLSGHFPLETRLSQRLWTIPQSQSTIQLFQQIFPDHPPRMHLPPVLRYILPGNVFAAVPPHQDVSYNKHVDDFFVLWVPFCKIDDECGGVVVHHGTGHFPELMANSERKFWLDSLPETGCQKVHCKMDAGDALLMNKWIVHESMPNTSNRIRLSSDFRFFTGQSAKHYLDMETWKVVIPQPEMVS